MIYNKLNTEINTPFTIIIIIGQITVKFNVGQVQCQSIL